MYELVFTQDQNTILLVYIAWVLVFVTSLTNGRPWWKNYCPICPLNNLHTSFRRAPEQTAESAGNCHVPPERRATSCNHGADFHGFSLVVGGTLGQQGSPFYNPDRQFVKAFRGQEDISSAFNRQKSKVQYSESMAKKYCLMVIV